MQTTRIKFCGITRSEDMATAVSLGVNALGFVFCSPSPRALDIGVAQKLLSNCPPFITRVGLFMDQEASTIKDILAHVPLDLIQFHGSESESFCASFKRPYIKSIAMRAGQANALFEQYPSAQALLLDSNDLGQPGGSGEVFDWQSIPTQVNKPVVLAGGLNADNVAAAIKQVRPYAVDVSSGIESDKGVKDKIKMKQFVKAVRATYEC